MRESTWKKVAMTAIKQHGFHRNAINHKFYCEWPHCLAVAEFESHDDQLMRIRFDMYVYENHDLMNFMECVDYHDYLTYQGNADFSLHEVNKEAAYDRVILALQESVPRITSIRE